MLVAAELWRWPYFPGIGVTIRNVAADAASAEISRLILLPFCAVTGIIGIAGPATSEWSVIYVFGGQMKYWQEALSRAVNRHDDRMKALARKADWVKESTLSPERMLHDIEREFVTEIERYSNAARRAVSWMRDPVVYVRDYNKANLSVYHGWVHCGWLNLDRAQLMVLGEAQAAGLRPCKSCGYLAVRPDGPLQDVAA